MSYDVYDILILLCSITIGSYLFNVLSVKLRIPSVILLMSSGLLLRYVAKYFNIHIPPLQQPLEFLGILGLILIVLEGSLELKISRQKGGMIFRSLLSAIIILLVTSFSIAYILFKMSDIEFINALAYAVPLGVISSAIAIPSAEALDVHKKEFIIYESTFSDICGIMLFNYVIADNILSGASVGNFFFSLLLIIVISIISTTLLLWLFNHLGGHTKIFLIFSLLILVYVFGKAFHLPSLLLILVFGIVINNIQPYLTGRLQKFLHPEKLGPITAELKTMTAELAFLIRTFFFLIFGYHINLHLLIEGDVILTGSLITLVILLIRAMTLRFVSHLNVFPEVFIAPRGLITVLLFYSIPAKLQTASFNEGVLTFVIIATAVIMMVGIMFSKRTVRSANQVLPIVENLPLKEKI